MPNPQSARAFEGKLGFHPGLTAEQVEIHLRTALNAIDRAEQAAVIWFAELNRRGLFRQLGYSSIHQYAEAALGFSRSRTFHFLRLAEDLERLPKLRAAVTSGEVGWTKAVQIARVASPRTEGRWLTEARRHGRRDLARLVAAARENTRRRREARLIQSSGQARLAIGNGSVASGNDGTTTSTKTTRPRTATTMTAPMVVPVAAATPRPPLTRHALPECEGPASVTFRMDPIQRARLDALVEKIRKARLVPRDTSREEILLVALETLSATTSSRPSASERKKDRTRESRRHGSRRRDSLSPYQIVIYKCESCQSASIRTPAGERRLSSAAAAAAACDASTVQADRPDERSRSSIPPAVRRAVLTRDGHRCRAPSCQRTHFLEVHHIVPRDRGGSHRPQNLITLCSSCHQLVHRRGGIRLRDWLQTVSPGGFSNDPTHGASGGTSDSAPDDPRMENAGAMTPDSSPTKSAAPARRKKRGPRAGSGRA